MRAEDSATLDGTGSSSFSREVDPGRSACRCSLYTPSRRRAHERSGDKITCIVVDNSESMIYVCCCIMSSRCITARSVGWQSPAVAGQATCEASGAVAPHKELSLPARSSSVSLLSVRSCRIYFRFCLILWKVSVSTFNLQRAPLSPRSRFRLLLRFSRTSNPLHPPPPDAHSCPRPPVMRPRYRI